MQTSFVICATVLCIGLSIAEEYPVYQANKGGTEFFLGSTSGFNHHQYPPPYVTEDNQNQQSYYYQPQQQQQAQTTQQQYSFHNIPPERQRLSQAPQNGHPIQGITQQQTHAPHQRHQVLDIYPPPHQQQVQAPQQRHPEIIPPQPQTQPAQQHHPIKDTKPQNQKHDPSTDERLEGTLPFGNYEVGFDAGPGFDSELFGVPGGSPPPYGFPDPSFATQAGFEGLLVPNTWYGLLPWGIEGVIIVIAGIIVFAIIVIAIIGLLLWLCGIRAVMPWIIKRDGDDLESELRSRQSDPWSLVNLSVDVLDALEKFNEVSLQDEEKIKKKV